MVNVVRTAHTAGIGFHVKHPLVLEDVTITDEKWIFRGKVVLPYCDNCGHNNSEEKVSRLPSRGRVEMYCGDCGQLYSREFGIIKGEDEQPKVIYLNDGRVISSV